MSEAVGSRSWREDLASLLDDAGIRYTGDGIVGVPVPVEMEAAFGDADAVDREEAAESFKDQLKGFLKGTGEMLQELGRGCRDIIRQSLGREDSYVVRKLGGPWVKVSSRLRFLNEYLPEDRDPMHAWPVVLSVLFLAFLVLNVNTEQQNSAPLPKKVYIRPPSATRVQLPDGRHIAYQERGVSSDKARFSLIAPHSFLSSRLAGIPGIKASLLEEFGVRFVTYDLPGFGESDPHPHRNLNSSALDMSYVANAVGVKEKFWVVGYSAGAMHAWAALRYIPDRLAGAAMFAPLCNPYESSMTKEERGRTWEKWTPRRKLMYFLARRFPSFLSFFYRRSFLSGHHGQLDRWLSLSLGKRDRALMEDPVFIEFLEKDVEESVRQWNPKPFVEEAVLQVSHWGFSLAHLQVQKTRQGKGLLPWLKSVYSLVERDWTGFLGPIHIWQGTDDRVVPPSMIDFVRRVVTGATVHTVPGEGHFSYYCFCDECHRQIFSTLFGHPQGPLSTTSDDQISSSAQLSQIEPDEVSLATDTAAQD
ncbi:uncharacterized protein LOC131243366 [Magnolia sinica]|uniref:uncharacterized protein LOC131243366 n=1 Tax=Magnolia sinica TaxID=86752 RepID=UPI00265AA44B|nr:uncharacterized protein LOC131243366 [Magnolia sinica]